MRVRTVAEKRLLASSCPPGATRFPLEGFSWNFTF